jgi:hypothetical protein
MNIWLVFVYNKTCTAPLMLTCRTRAYARKVIKTAKKIEGYSHSDIRKVYLLG